MLKKWIALAMAAVFVLSISGAAMAAGKLVKVPTAWMDEHETFLMWYAKEKGWIKKPVWTLKSNTSTPAPTF